MGAVNAAVLAAEPTLERAAELVPVWAALSGRDVFPGSRIEPPGAPRAADHLYAPTGLRHLLERHLPHTRIEEAAVPLVVVAADLTTGAERRLTQGPVVEAVLARAAIRHPRRRGRRGVGARHHPALHSPPAQRSAVDVALQAIAVLARARAEADLACPPRQAVVHCGACVRSPDTKSPPGVLAELHGHGLTPRATAVGS